MILQKLKKDAEAYLGDKVTEAVITSIVPFGAFARLEEGLDGLIHVSEMNQLDEENTEPLEEGSSVKVRILQVESSRQRMALSLPVILDRRGV